MRGRHFHSSSRGDNFFSAHLKGEHNLGLDQRITQDDGSLLAHLSLISFAHPPSLLPFLAGAVSSEKPTSHVPPEAEGLSRPGSHTEGERPCEHAVPFHWPGCSTAAVWPSTLTLYVQDVGERLCSRPLEPAIQEPYTALTLWERRHVLICNSQVWESSVQRKYHLASRICTSSQSFSVADSENDQRKIIQGVY